MITWIHLDSPSRGLYHNPICKDTFLMEGHIFTGSGEQDVDILGGNYAAHRPHTAQEGPQSPHLSFPGQPPIVEPMSTCSVLSAFTLS